MHAFTCTGEFWLPGNEKNTFKGTLRFDPREGIELSLDQIEHMNYLLSKGKRTIPCIQGNIVTPQQAQVTMYKVQLTHPLRASYILWGALLPEKNVLFQEFSFSFLCSLTLETRVQKLFPSNDVTIDIDFQKSTATISFQKDQDLDTCLDYFGKLFNFLTTISLEKVIPLSLYATTNTGNRVEILYSHPVFRDERATPWLLPKEAPETLGRKGEEALAHWFDPKYPHSVADFYVAAVYNLGSPFWGNLRYSFFLLVNAIECYQSVLVERGIFKTTEDNPAFQEINALIGSSCLSKEAQDFWKERKERLVRKSLKTQFEDIYRYWQKAMDVLNFVRDASSRKEFFKKVVDQRNDIAHGRKIQKMEELYENFYRLRLFLELCLLGELGFTPEECREIIRQAWYFERFQVP